MYLIYCTFYSFIRLQNDWGTESLKYVLRTLASNKVASAKYSYSLNIQVIYPHYLRIVQLYHYPKYLCSICMYRCHHEIKLKTCSCMTILLLMLLIIRLRIAITDILTLLMYPLYKYSNGITKM